jgi:glycerophosphoryl diester phosphodiesterase
MPLITAHRGSSAQAPEHTLAAYQQAIDDGADALECDVRLTADGVLVCVHDRTVNRTSNGRGVVSTLELADLAELDFGSWRDTWEDFEDPVDPDRRSVLTLESLLDLVADCPRPLELAIETKHPTRYAGLVEERLVALLDRYGWAHPRLGQRTRVRVMSFSMLSMRRMRRLAPSVPTVFLMERVPLRMRDGSLPPGVRIGGPSIEILREHPRYVMRLREQGHQVHVWTVDEPADLALCADLGVDVVITNRPAEARRQFEAIAANRPR